MNSPIDFSKMTLEELTPIVSMRPGKEYTREDLRAARAAFMAALENADASSCAPAEKAPVEASATAAVEPVPETEPVFPAISEETESAASVAAEIISPSADPVIPAVSAAEPYSENTEKQDIAFAEESFSSMDAANEEPFVPAENKDAAADAAPLEIPEEKAPDAPSEEEFILKTESRLARFLYILYAYLLVPLLAAEALIFLLASVVTAVAVRGIPYLFLHILCAVIYTMTVSIAWHQFLHRTKFGLLLNRALIGVCIFRGISMLLSGESILLGILFTAPSALFLVFFVGYDSTFVIKSPEKQHVQ